MPRRAGKNSYIRNPVSDRLFWLSERALGLWVLMTPERMGEYYRCHHRHSTLDSSHFRLKTERFNEVTNIEPKISADLRVGPGHRGNHRLAGSAGKDVALARWSHPASRGAA